MESEAEYSGFRIQNSEWGRGEGFRRASLNPAVHGTFGVPASKSVESGQSVDDSVAHPADCAAEVEIGGGVGHSEANHVGNRPA